MCNINKLEAFALTGVGTCEAAACKAPIPKSHTLENSIDEHNS